MSRLEKRWEEDCVLSFEATDVFDGRGKDIPNPVYIEICLSSQFISYNDELHWPFGRFEFHGLIVRLFVRGNKAHVAARNVNESGHIFMSSNGM